jgi:YHS domain-containing protein
VTAVDPVCQMKVDERNAKWMYERLETTYNFCSPSCKKGFDQDPSKYFKK